MERRCGTCKYRGTADIRTLHAPGGTVPTFICKCPCADARWLGGPVANGPGAPYGPEYLCNCRTCAAPVKGWVLDIDKVLLDLAEGAQQTGGDDGHEG